MNPTLFSDTGAAVNQLGQTLRWMGAPIDALHWQGIEAPATMLEFLGASFRAPIPESSDMLAFQVKPNRKWADEHFSERVSGIPSNPGKSYINWPYYPKGERDQKYRPDQEFTHTYQERLWPRYSVKGYDTGSESPRKGIRYEYGDLRSVVQLLGRDPLTRQAFIPIWFPEDTGGLHGGRLPCTIGYWMVQRRGFLHCTYYIRSCDYFRHLRDDIYLAGRLMQWILSELSSVSGWDTVKPGFLDMHIGSLHCWLNEKGILPR